MANESVLVLIKPDAMQRGLAGAVLSRLESLRCELLAAKVVRVSRQLAETHYQHLREKPFFLELLDFLQGKMHGGSPVMALVLWGTDAVERIRQLVGATNPKNADPTSIRGALGRDVMENLIHASATAEEARKEISLWFAPNELLTPPSP